MSYLWNQISLTAHFSEALAFSNRKAGLQSDVTPKAEDEELSELEAHFEKNGFSVQSAIEEGKDISFHLDRTRKMVHGIFVNYKNVISADLLDSIAKFLEGRMDTQIVIVNGCNPIGEEPEEEVPDFWICLVAGGGIFYAEADEVTKLFQRTRVKQM